MSKKYILHPQWITSRTDGQRLFISAQRLAELYRVKLDDCYISGAPLFPTYEEEKKIIHLYPSYDGIYEIGAMNNPIKNIVQEYTDCLGAMMRNDDETKIILKHFLGWLAANNYIRLIERGGQ